MHDSSTTWRANEKTQINKQHSVLDTEFGTKILRCDHAVWSWQISWEKNDLVFLHFCWSGSILHCTRPQKSSFHSWKCECPRLDKPFSFNLQSWWTFGKMCVHACLCSQRNLTELIVAVDVGNLLQLYASMLFERRIIIFASKLSTVRPTDVLYFICRCRNMVMNWKRMLINNLNSYPSTSTNITNQTQRRQNTVSS